MSKSTGTGFTSQSLFATLAELVGTFFLTLVALTVASPVTAYAVGLTLLVFVYTIGGLSGCHLNPAVTVGLVASWLRTYFCWSSASMPSISSVRPLSLYSTSTSISA